MRWASWTVGAILLVLAAAQTHAAAPAFPDRGRSAVVDAAGAIPDEAEAALEGRLVAWNRATGHQLVVATVPSLQGLQIHDYGNGLLRHWGLGQAQANDGVILLLAPNERQVRIEVGYGLEPVLTDALSSRIIRETIRPSLRAGDVVGALTAGAERIMRAATPGAAPALQGVSQHAGKSFPWAWITAGVVALAALGFFFFPLFELWFAVWPFYVVMPARAKRAEARHQAKMAEARRQPGPGRAEASEGAKGASVAGRTNSLSTVAAMADSMRNKQEQKRRSDARADRARRPGGSDALESLRHRARDSYGSNDSYDSGAGSSDSGFDGGGGSGGGGGADSSY